MTLKPSKSAWGISITTLDTVDDFETLASCCFSAYQCMNEGIYLLQNQIFTLRRNYISNNFFIISHKFFIVYIIYDFFFVNVKTTWNSNIITINKFFFVIVASECRYCSWWSISRPSIWVRCYVLLSKQISKILRSLLMMREGSLCSLDGEPPGVHFVGLLI